MLQLERLIFWIKTGLIPIPAKFLSHMKMRVISIFLPLFRVEPDLVGIVFILKNTVMAYRPSAFFANIWGDDGRCESIVIIVARSSPRS